MERDQIRGLLRAYADSGQSIYEFCEDLEPAQVAAVKRVIRDGLGEPEADALRDLDALRAGLERLDNAELGRVLAVVLRGLDQRGDSPLPALLRVLADQVDELMADLEQSAKPPVHFYDRADGRTVCDWDNHSNTTQCGRAYSDHPTETYGDLVLHRLCDGRLVKL